MDGPSTYLGVGVDGFPNLFTITGPQSPSVLSNMPVSIEQHVDYIGRIIDDLRARGAERIEPTKEAEDALRDASDALTLSRADQRRWFSVDDAGHHAPMDQPIH